MNGSQLYLVVVYISLILINIHAVWLYYTAYVKMKRTRMIKSVFLLLCAFLIENVYFLCIAMNKKLIEVISNTPVHPLLWSIPKLIVMSGLLYFIWSSLSPSDYNTCKHKNDELCKDRCVFDPHEMCVNKCEGKCKK